MGILGKCCNLNVLTKLASGMVMGPVSSYAHKYLGFLKGELGFAVISVAITCAIYVALYLFWHKTSERRSLRGLLRYVFPVEVFGQSRIDFFAYILAKLAWAPLLAKIVAFFAAETWALHFLNARFGEHILRTSNSWLVLLMQFAVFYLSFNFAFYWAHRWMHQNSFLWSVHRTHHSTEALTFMTGARTHPIESVGVALWTIFLSGSIAAALNYCTGLATHPLFLAAISVWMYFMGTVDQLQHSHLPTSLGPLNYIIPLGAMHRIHHSAEPKYRDRNFGNGTSLFDWMFGTIYLPEPEEAMRLGLSDQELGARNPHQRVIDIYTEPFVYAWRVVRGRKAALADQTGVPPPSAAQTGGASAGA